MISKYFKFFLLILLFYQTPALSKSDSFEKIDSEPLSNYFSGIVAFENKRNSDSLNFFRTSKILIDKHDPYLKRYVYALVLDGKVQNAINLIKRNLLKNNSNFFESYLLLIADSLKRNDFDKAEQYLIKLSFFTEQNRFNLIVHEILKRYIYVFKEKKLFSVRQRLGNLDIITETFTRCYLGDQNIDEYYSQLTSQNNKTDFSRYIFFYFSYLIESNQLEKAKEISKNIKYINNTILVSQGKNWIDNGEYKKFDKIFSCQNHLDLISEFFFLISNLYSSQEEFKKSNFYINVSNYLNPDFIFNLASEADNYYQIQNYKKAKKLLRNLKEENLSYYWFRLKKEAQIVSETSNKKNAANFLYQKYLKLKNHNPKMILDVGNFFKRAQDYETAIKFYTKVLNLLNTNSDSLSDILYRRGGSYERIGDFENSDKDLIESLSINPNNAYVLNYLAYSWLERDYKINEAIKMLEKAYATESEDPYIIDSIGWAYFLIGNYIKAEKFLKKAVQLMPMDPIVNDHYGDILWKLGRKIQARYFWSSVLTFEDTEEEMKDKIEYKLISGLKKT